LSGVFSCHAEPRRYSRATTREDRAMQVKEILRVKGNRLLSIEPNGRAADAIKTMAKENLGSLVVMEGGRMIGMLTFRELLLALSAADIQRELDRRKPGSSRHVTQRRESDTIELLSGIYEGRTTGTAIGFLIRNEDQRSKDYSAIADKFRPGHADYTYLQKYGVRDARGGGRASARETVVRVAAGAIAKKWLASRYGVRVRGYLAALGRTAI